MTLSVRILGCGSSGGVPRLGGADGAGNWGACDPAEPRNRRSRCSILVRNGATQVLVDTSPDMRQQLLAARIRMIALDPSEGIGSMADRETPDARGCIARRSNDPARLLG